MQEKVTTLVQMGYDQKAAEEALKNSNDDIAAAITYLYEKQKTTSADE